MMSVMGLQVQAIGVGWLIYALTGSVLHLGLVGMAQFVPTACLALFTGRAADRWDRRRILVVRYSAECLCACVLLVLVVTGTAPAATMLGTLVAFGAARAFENPATNALLLLVVPRRIFANAVAVNTSALQTATIVGPALGGVATVVAAALWAWWFPSLRRVDRLDALDRPRADASIRRSSGGVMRRPVERDGTDEQSS